jgi:hypothetical protein
VNDLSVERGTSGFVEGVLVWTDKGSVPIESVKPGDAVLSQPDDGGDCSYRKVLRTVRHDQKSIVAIRYEDPSDGNTRVTYATDEQALWCTGRGWVSAMTLRSRTELQASHGRMLKLKQIAPVYATDVAGRGWNAFSASYDPLGLLVDFDGGFRSVPGDNVRMSDVVDESKARLFVQVFHLEVEEFRSFYVGSSGLRVRGAS